jgi:hypothetical protein
MCGLRSRRWAIALNALVCLLPISGGAVGSRSRSVAAAKLTDPLGGAGAVAYFAYLGGFVFGLALIGLLARHGRLGTAHAPVY